MSKQTIPVTIFDVGFKVPVLEPKVVQPAVEAKSVIVDVPPMPHQQAPLKEQGFSYPSLSSVESILDFLRQYYVASFVLLFLVISVSGIKVGANYYSARLISNINKSSLILKPQTSAVVAGLNVVVPTNQLQTKLKSITSQPASLSVGSQTMTIAPSTIKSWLKISSISSTQSDIHVNAATITSSLDQLANQYVVAPVNQVSVTHNDGVTPSGVILAGENGTMLSDPATLGQQASLIAKNLMNGNNNLQFSTPLKSLPFQAATPANFGKLLEVDLTTKRMYAYQNGQLVNTFLVSAGKPSTPTPQGEFHIWEKLTMQTMVGPGYVQPDVPWINYFDHSGDAVHGVYWRPASVFGNINTSHGCVGLAVNLAEWVYDWAPIGTTVITYS